MDSVPVPVHACNVTDTAHAQGMSPMIGEGFSRCGAEVRFSLEADNDDTLAAHAELDGAAILSSDQDFFRQAKEELHDPGRGRASSCGLLYPPLHPHLSSSDQTCLTPQVPGLDVPVVRLLLHLRLGHP